MAGERLMANSKSNGKRIIVAVSIISALTVLCLCIVTVYAGMFMKSNINDMEEYCRNKSNKQATGFYSLRFNAIPGYIFAVSQGGNDDYGQELFIFRDVNFGAIKRLALEYHSGKSENKSIGSYQFRPIMNGKQSDDSFLIFYSANEERVERVEYTTSYNMDGIDYKIQATHKLASAMPFITTGKAMNTSEKVESVCLFDENSKLVYKF